VLCVCGVSMCVDSCVCFVVCVWSVDVMCVCVRGVFGVCGVCGVWYAYMCVVCVCVCCVCLWCVSVSCV